MTLRSLLECKIESTPGIAFINNVSQLTIEILYSYAYSYFGGSFDSDYLLYVCSPHPET